MPAAMSATEMPTRAGDSAVPVIESSADLALHQQVVGFFLRRRAGRAVARDVAHDEPRVRARAGPAAADAEPIRRAWREVLHEDVGTLDETRRERSRLSGRFRSSVSDSFERFSQTK